MGPLLVSGGASFAWVSTRMQLNHMAAPIELVIALSTGMSPWSRRTYARKS